MNKVAFIILIFCFSFAQELTYEDSLLTDTPLKDPSTATWLSIALPGAGQAYNESYWKTALLLPAFSYFLYRAIDQDDLMWDTRSQISSQQKNIATLEAIVTRTESEEANLLSLKEKLANLEDKASDAKEARSLAIWRTGLVYLINVLDAYIGAYMFGFDELLGEPTNQAFQFHTTAVPTELRFNVQYNF
jgi:hypothetical protein